MRPAFCFAVASTLTVSPFFCSLPAFAQSAKKLEKTAPTSSAPLSGVYQGKIQVGGGISLTLVFRVSTVTGKPTATLEVPEQGGRAIPVTSVVVSGSTVTFEITPLQASFTGKRAADGKRIVGTFTQHASEFPLTLVANNVVAALPRPQTPKPPFPYRTEDVSYANPKVPGLTLAGTLTLPEGTQSFPVVLFITGSGPQDRDETIMEHKPFAVIADYLARQGIASLRVDDRGVGKSTGTPVGATSADFAEDTRAGITYLKTRSEIDGKQIGLIGHSEGGIIAPLVASGNPDVAFIVLLAGTGVPGREVIMEQQKAISVAMGASPVAIGINQKLSRQFIDLILAAPDTETAKQKVKAAITENAKAVPEKNRAEYVHQVEGAFLVWCEPWFKYFLQSDPAPVLQSVSCPVLALNGSLDTQVLPKQNLPAIQQALEKGNDKDATVREMPGLNHLFQHAKTGAPSEYVTITETISPEVLTIIGDWIKAHTQKAP